MRYLNPSLLYILAVPIAAGLATVRGVEIDGFNYTGLLWVFFLLSGILVFLMEKVLHPERRALFPYGPWLLFFGYTWLSLIWCDGVGGRNIQDALQISMPILVGVIASIVVRSEAQFRLLIRSCGFTLLLLVLCVAAMFAGVLPLEEDTSGPSCAVRALALTASLLGCVFISGYPPSLIASLAGWATCVLVVTSTGSRMATFALLLATALHPLRRGLVRRVAALSLLAGLGIALYHTPLFQERFFHSGAGTLADVLEGKIRGSGRFDAWPLIWDEAWKHPIFGVGVGSTYDFVPTVWTDMHHAHNDYLRVGYELGLTGLALFLGVLLWQAWDLKRRIARTDGMARRAFAASLLGLFVFSIAAVTGNPLVYNLWFTNPLFAVMGAAYGLQRRVPSPQIPFTAEEFPRHA